MNNKRRLTVILSGIVLIVVVVVVLVIILGHKSNNNNEVAAPSTSTPLTISSAPTTSSTSTLVTIQSTSQTSKTTSVSASTIALSTTQVSTTTVPTTTTTVPSTSTTIPPTTVSTTPYVPPVIDLTKWAGAAYQAMPDEDYFPASWNLASDKKSITEVNNCQPALFYSDFLAMNSKVIVKINPLTTSEPDDDYFGFALGIQPNDVTNSQANYLLVDWKNSIPGETLYKDFTSPGAGGQAKVGLALSRVQGIPTPDEFWQHTDQDSSASPKGQGLTELARATNLGDKGWIFDHEYVFTFEFNETSLKVYVDGTLEISVSDKFTDGRLAFYNFSQAGVRYSVNLPST